MAQVAEIKFGQKVMEKETEKKISEIEGVCVSVSTSCVKGIPKEVQISYILIRLTRVTDLQQTYNEHN